MESDRASTAVDDYLRRLDQALVRVHEPLASQVRDGITEELRSVAPEEALVRIQQLGDPTHIAAEASDDSAALTPGDTGKRGSRAYVAGTVALLSVGGILFPFIGWIAGLIFLWSGSVWRTAEKVVATLSPLVAGGLAFALYWLFTSPPSSAGINPLIPAATFAHWNVLIVGVAVNLGVAVWLLAVGLRRAGR